jgi:hypothetical protein
MKLSDYKKTGLTHDKFSKKVNVTRPMITLLVLIEEKILLYTHEKTQLKHRNRKENKKTENT